jgi:hypothetical protein
MSVSVFCEMNSLTGGTGSCHLDEATKSVRYMHIGIKTDGTPLIVEDVFTWLSGLMEAVNAFLGQIFHFLRNSLKSTRVMQICGEVEGRFLMRFVDPTGISLSRAATASPISGLKSQTRPHAHSSRTDGAYARTRPMMNPAALLATTKTSD